MAAPQIHQWASTEGKTVSYRKKTSPSMEKAGLKLSPEFTFAAWSSFSSMVIAEDTGFSMHMKSISDFSKATRWACLSSPSHTQKQKKIRVKIKFQWIFSLLMFILRWFMNTLPKSNHFQKNCVNLHRENSS